jgi:trehalose 6-phosphate phosphatase
VTAAGVAGLAAIQADPDHALLAFDFDGVIAPIVADPESSRPDPRVLAALARLSGQVGQLAVVTGRPAEVAVRFGGFADLPGLESLVVFGHYGRERWEARSGQLVAPPPHPGVARARAALPDLLAGLGAGTAWIEDKGGAVAVHTRRCNDPQGTFLALHQPLAELAEQLGLMLEPGRLVLELRPGGTDKGTTLRTYAAELDARAVAYVGDDLGDLPAFAAVEALREHGVPGLKVASASAEVPELARHADLVVDGPPGVADLLHSLADTLPR